MFQYKPCLKFIGSWLWGSLNVNRRNNSSMTNDIKVRSWSERFRLFINNFCVENINILSRKCIVGHLYLCNLIQTRERVYVTPRVDIPVSSLEFSPKLTSFLSSSSPQTFFWRHVVMSLLYHLVKQFLWRNHKINVHVATSTAKQ